ncbi:hypothetical protein [Rhizobium sp. BK418]|uniref:hypothetical protein n=1 Tax=Rhizobium sp. BK418 TaxID=2512120 RepID=UPI0010E9C909|nr:hypothetical protein [Rhizobium sp. BK418]TCR95955.1 hypothetical protein EV281_1123 [Rhizobium sp. BK418]
MTTPALIRKADMIRAAQVAKQTGCRLEIKIGDTTITVIPEESKQLQNGIDYGRPVL